MDSYRSIFLEHHFSAATRDARRKLLGVAVMAYLLIQGEWVPERIDFLGIAFGLPQRRTLYTVLMALLIYYFLKFYLYMFTDGEVHMHKTNAVLVDSPPLQSWKERRRAIADRQRVALKALGAWGFVLVGTRLMLDYLLPVMVGGYGVILVSNALGL